MSSNLLRVVQEQQETIEKQSRLIADLIATLESWEQTAGYDGEELKERAKRFAIKRKAGFMNMTITEFIEAAAHNKIIQLVVLAIVCDTVFGVLRAIKEKKFNSCAGIDGAIRKVGMLISLVFMLAIDVLIKINLIGFIPEQARVHI